MDLPFLSMTLPEMIQAVGYVGVFLIVFVESGVPIGLFLPLPGDTLLFSAGILAATSVFDLAPLLAVIIVAAILGDSAGYWFGARFGTRLFEKDDAVFLNRRNLARTQAFYMKRGASAIIIARFLPVFRTLVPLCAGVARMDYRKFVTYNIAGACIWGVSLTLLGYYLGQVIPNVDHYVMPVLAVVILFSTGSLLLEVWRAKRKQKETAAL